MSSSFTYTKIVNSDRLRDEINSSSITIQLLSIITVAPDVQINFKTDISPAEETTLGDIVTNHVPTPLKPEPIEVITIPQDPEGIAYQARTYDLDLTGVPDAEGFVNKSVSFANHDINLLLAQLHFDVDQIGDEVEGVIEPSTPFGIISQDVQVGSNLVYCDLSTLSIFKPGMFLILSDGNNVQDMGEVQVIDNEKITCANTSSFVFATSTPTAILARIKAIRDFKVPFPGCVSLGSAHHGGSKLLKNWVLKLRYKKNGLTTKLTERVVLEFLYQSEE